LTFDVSPDGKTVLVGGVGPHDGELISVDFATGKQTVLKHAGPVGRYSHTTYSVSGAWSPDGKSVLYERMHFMVRNDVFVDPGTLVLAHPNGTGGHVLLSSAHLLCPPHWPQRDNQLVNPFLWSWSPDGRRILLYEQTGGCGIRTLILDPSNGRTRLLTTRGPSSIHAPLWAPDSQRVAINLGCTTVFSATGDLLHREACIVGGGDPQAWTKSGLYIPAYATLYRSDNGIGAPVRVFRLPKSLTALETVVPR
jgi:hypothetical protein